MLTDDYLADPAFDHAPEPDRVVADIGIRSMVAAPIVAGDEVFGALGRVQHAAGGLQRRRSVALVRALADHAAAAMANARLIEALDHSRAELAKRADVERSLREIAARISAAADLPGRAAASRRRGRPAPAMPTAPASTSSTRGRTRCRPAYASGDSKLDAEEWPEDPDETIDQGVAGQAVVTRQARSGPGTT